MSVKSCPSVPGLGRALAYLQISRLRMAPLAAIPYAVGARAGGGDALLVAGAWSLGTLLHSYACFVNDLADAEDDAANPQRSRSPLVTGAIEWSRVLHAALLHVVVFALILRTMSPDPSATLGLVGLWSLMTYGNIFQKRSRSVSPLMMDFLCGVAMGSPVVVACLLADPGVPQAAVWLAVCFGLQLALANGAAGNLKDLEADRDSELRTTAIVMGVDVDERGLIVAPPVYRRYVQGLQLLAGLCALAAVAAALDPDTGSAQLIKVLTGLIVLAGTWFGLRGLNDLVSGRHPRATRGREEFIVINLVVFLAAAVPALGVVFTATLALVSIVWVVAFTNLVTGLVAASTQESAHPGCK